MRVGKYERTAEIRLKQSLSAKGRKGRVGAANPLWRGDAAHYTRKHSWISKHFGKPRLCEDCGLTDRKMYDWANLTGKYMRERSDWRRLCRSCHMRFDRELHSKHREKFTVGDQSMTLKEWAAETGINFHTLFGRVHSYRWPIERAISEPVRRQS